MEKKLSFDSQLSAMADKSKSEMLCDDLTIKNVVMYGTIKKIQSEKESYRQRACRTMVVVFAAVVASVGGILFGYDIGITSGALLQLKEEFQLSSFEQEMVVSSVLIGAFFASFFGGNIVDSWGRKIGIGVSCILFIVGALLLCFSFHIYMILIGRFIVGIAVSLSVTSECTYISEISPPSQRGMMVSLNEVGITIGFLLAYLINYLFISVPSGWKFMFGAAAILAFIQGFGLIFMPKSHYYLLIKGKEEEARKVLTRLRNTDNVDEEMETITTAILEQKNYRYMDLFRTVGNMRSRMLLAMALVFLQQFSGHANVLYYAPTVFQHFGYHSDSVATLVTVGLGVVKVLATVVTLSIVDRVGRRTLLLIGCIVMAISVMTLGIVGTFQVEEPKKAIFIHQHPVVLNQTIMTDDENQPFVTPETGWMMTDAVGFSEYVTSKDTNGSIILMEMIKVNNSVLDGRNNFYATESSNNGTLLNSTNITEIDELYEDVSMASKIISVVSLMIFVCAYGMSYGPVTWLVLSEIFPGPLRGRAISVATCINWGSNIIVSLTFLDILNSLGIGPTFILYGFISAVATIFIYLCLPETKGKTLEEIDVLLSNGFIQKDFKLCNESSVRKTYSLNDINQLNGIQTKEDSKEETKNINLKECSNLNNL